MNINLQIKRLILDGVSLPHHQRPVLQSAVEAELARLLADGALAPELLASRRLASAGAGSIEISADSEPGSLGRQIAQALHQGISESKR
jgi:hypothetical protein